MYGYSPSYASLVPILWRHNGDKHSMNCVSKVRYYADTKDLDKHMGISLIYLHLLSLALRFVDDVCGMSSS